MTRILWKLALGISLALLASPSDVFAGRGGGRGGGGGGGFGGGRGGGGGGGGGSFGGENRGGNGGGNRGGGMGGTPSFSQPRGSMNQSRGSGNPGQENRSAGNRSPSGNQPGSGNRSQSGNPAGLANRNQNSSNAGAAAGLANRNQNSSNAGAAAGLANRNQNSSNAGAAAGASYANRNQGPSNAGTAAAGAGYANRNQNPSNAGAAAAGAGYANRNQGPSNAGAAAAGAGYANRNQGPSNAGAAAAGAGYANRNQGPSTAGAAAAGAGYANRNQGLSNADAAAAGASYANRNQYDGYHPGVVNGYWNGNNSAAWGASGLALGAAAGVGAWNAGSPMYAYGYTGYSNPYSAGTGGGSQPNAPQQPGAGAQQAATSASDYSQPISTTAALPEPAVADQATLAFNQAREAFKTGDYANALQLDQQALAQTPNDTTLHEFLALVLFAQGKYEQAAAPLYAVLSVGPGWDWTTLSGMYPEVATYTEQLRNLETYIAANPKSAQARFVLAYQYLSEGHDDAAVTQLKQVVTLQPTDTLSAQLVAHLQPSGDSPPSTPSSGPAAPAGSPAVEGKLPGKWAATPAKDASIALTIQDDGRFSWAMTGQGKPAMTIAGESTFADGVLTLVDQGGQNGTLAGKVTWQDASHFNFRLTDAPATDPGLTFAQ